jgi:aspartate racemase
MRKIGLLGGMSWESSALYYEILNEAVRDRLGGYHSARVLMSSVDFAEVEAMQAAGEWEAAGRLLAAEAAALEAAGAECVVLCTNTMHKVADAVRDAVGIPFLHLADTTATAAARAGLSTLGLLGTAFTMEQDFYRDRLAGHGFTVLTPDAGDRAEVHRIIYDELCLGIVRDESRKIYREVIARLAGRGADGVVLGCTEIELLVSADDSPVAVLPTTRLHVEAAIDWALGAG